MNSTAILIPTLNEETVLPELLRSLNQLNPQADEIIFVDGGSDDRTVELLETAGQQYLVSPEKGRGAQINFGVQHCRSDLICVLHADSRLPEDGVTVIRENLGKPHIALASFTPRVAGPNGTRWGSTLHNWIKTWYIPLIARPLAFLRGARLLYGDHAMFFRRADFVSIGGCDERAAIMEEAELCLKFAQLGQVKILPRWVWTSDRRIEELGRWRANWLYFKVGMMWAIGRREKLADHYPDVR